jgi:hypothetical protein
MITALIMARTGPRGPRKYLLKKNRPKDIPRDKKTPAIPKRERYPGLRPLMPAMTRGTKRKVKTTLQNTGRGVIKVPDKMVSSTTAWVPTFMYSP